MLRVLNIIRVNIADRQKIQHKFIIHYMGQDTTARVIVQNLKEIFRKSVKTVSVTAGCAKSVRNKTGGEQMLKTLYLIIWLAAMSYADIKRRKINIISIVVMGAGIIMLHLADVIDGSELELHLLIRDYYIPAVIIGAGLYIIARITHITGEADAIVIAYITVLTGMYITIQTVLLSMFLIIITGGTLIAGGRMKLRTSMPYIPFLLVSLVCCVIGGGTILRTLLQ